jgi:hypothetical protein
MLPPSLPSSGSDTHWDQRSADSID